MKFAVIGSGYIAQNHIAAIQQAPDSTLAAIVARNGEKGAQLAAQAGCAYYPTLEEAVTGAGVTAVSICVPTYLHEEFVIEAARLKCHVLCEKPVTFTVESFDRMARACKDAGVRFMVAQVARYWPEFAVIKRYLDGKKLGKVHMIYEKRICQHPTWSTWHRDPDKSGGALYDMNIHDIDFLVSCLGRPAKLYATGWKSESGCWNHVATNLTWPDGTQAVVETSFEMTGAWPFSIEFRGVGDLGTLSYELTAGVNINDGERGSNLMWYPAGGEPEPLEAEQSDMFREEVAEFVSGVREGRPFAVTDDQVRTVLKIVLATKKSLEEGCVVKL